MKPVVELIRLEESVFFGTFGVLKINKEVFCVTLEPADLLNKKNVSSIPAQQYLCQRYSSAKYPDTFQVLDVPDRDNVLFHPGNKIADTRACILTAEHFGKIRGDRAILNSGKTFKLFMETLKGIKLFHFTIREIY